MTTVEVFDPPMCCSTGVCGPSVDPALAAFAADLAWLGQRGTTVERHNLSQEPGAFAGNDVVRSLLAEQGDKALPAVVVDGTLRSWGRYPSRDELVRWAQEQVPECIPAADAGVLVDPGVPVDLLARDPVPGLGELVVRHGSAPLGGLEASSGGGLGVATARLRIKGLLSY